MKYISEILMGVILVMYLMVSSGVGVYEYYCNLEKETRLSIFEESHHCCEHNTSDEKSCCQKSSIAVSSCSLEKDVCCNHIYTVYKIENEYLNTHSNISGYPKHIVNAVRKDLSSQISHHYIGRSLYPLKILPVKEVLYQICVLRL